jgi:hypothetical protein
MLIDCIHCQASVRVLVGEREAASVAQHVGVGAQGQGRRVAND